MVHLRRTGYWLLFVLIFLLGGCGGDDGGDFDNQGERVRVAEFRVSLSADKTTLQTNAVNTLPDISGPFTNTLTVQFTKDGNPFAASSIAIDIVTGLSSGALYYLDGDPDHEYCPVPGPKEQCPVALLPSAYRRLVFGDADNSTTGTVTAHFHSSGTPGTVVLRASAQDDTGKQVSAELTLTVGPGVSTGQPAVVGLVIVPSPLYITGLGREDVKRFQVQVLDDANQPVPNPAGNNLRLQLLPNRPNGGEKLVAISASGRTEEGEIVNTRTINGVAEVALHSGTVPGTVAILATVDRADNNVDNGVQTAVTDVDTIPIGSGQITSLTFTGPYPGAVQARANTLKLGPNEIFDAPGGVYVRAINVLAVDEFGNPPPPGQFVTFRLIDGPMTGYPEKGRGTFNIAGKDGNPEEGGNTFTTPAGGSSLLGATTNCQLVLEGGPGQEGSWIVNGLAQPHLLAVFSPFNAVADTGFTVPYTVGCPPYVGNVANNINGVSVYTDEYGMASTVISYPITQLGRCFKLTAEANGGKVGAVMGKEKLGSTILGDQCTSWYLGIPDDSILIVIPASDQSLPIPAGQTTPATKTITLQLLDGGVVECEDPCDNCTCDQITPPAPLPAEKLSVQIVITDPDQDAVAAAEAAVESARVAVAAAQAALTASGCPATPPAENDPAVCADLRKSLANARGTLAQAEGALDLAKTRDAQYNPTASFTPPSPLITGADGLAALTITVSDLYTKASGGAGDAKVQFFISTVGPEVRANTIVITVLPQGAATP